MFFKKLTVITPASEVEAYTELALQS